MQVKINGKTVENVESLEIREEASDLVGWVVIILGILACCGWYLLWS